MKSLNLKGSREVKKTLRTQKVGMIVVTVGDKQFDGDETSQRRMFMYAQRMRANATATIPWVLADNTMADVTADELEQALDLAMRKQGELWFL